MENLIFLYSAFARIPNLKKKLGPLFLPNYFALRWTFDALLKTAKK